MCQHAAGIRHSMNVTMERIHVFPNMCISACIQPSKYLSDYPSIHLPISLICLHLYLDLYLSLSTYVFYICLSICLSIYPSISFCVYTCISHQIDTCMFLYIQINIHPYIYIYMHIDCWRLHLQIQVAPPAWMRIAAASRFACRCRWKIPRTSASAQGIQEQGWGSELGGYGQNESFNILCCNATRCTLLSDYMIPVPVYRTWILAADLCRMRSQLRPWM